MCFVFLNLTDNNNYIINKINVFGVDYLFFPELMISVFVIAIAIIGIFSIVVVKINSSLYGEKNNSFTLYKETHEKLSYYLNLSRLYVYLCIFFMCLMLFIYASSLRVILWNYSYVMNNEIILAKIFLIFVFILFLFLFIYFIDVIKYIIFEVIFLLLFSILGLIFAFSSNDFISLFLSIELYGFSIYLAIALFRKSVFSLEAAFKYFIVGSFSSIILLVGIAIIYGLTGSFYFDDIAVLFYFLNIDSSANLFISKLALFIIIISLFIKIAVAPFHFWSIDVYEGVPLVFMFFLLVITKFSFLFLFFRLLTCVFWSFYNYFWIILFIGTIITYVIGICGAVLQVKLRRILIYSSISNTSFFLSILLSCDTNIFPIFFYFSIFYFLSTGVIIFLVALICGINSRPSLDSLMGLFWKSKWIALLLISSIIIMAGFPPAITFFPKFLIIYNLFISDSIAYKFLSVFLVIGSSLSIFYYIRLIRLIFVKNFDVLPNTVKPPYSVLAVFTFILLFLIVSIFFCESIFDAIAFVS